MWRKVGRGSSSRISWPSSILCLKSLVGNSDLFVLVIIIFVEQSAIEIGNVADQRFEKSAAIDADLIHFIRRIQPREKERLEPVAVKVLARNSVVALIGFPNSELMASPTLAG